MGNSVNRALGLALIVIGVGLAYWGFQISETLSSQLAEKISGTMSDEVMLRYIGGAACGVAGLFLTVWG
jgi:uncharacterized protein YjeT (DUF2065 family)